MNIVMFTEAYYPRVSGIVVSIKSFSEQLTKMGHHVFIVCPDYEDVKIKRKQKKPILGCYYDDTIPQNENIKVLRVLSDPLIWSKEDRLVKLNTWNKVKHAVDEIHPDVIHINSEFIIGYFGLMYARHRHVASVYTFHTMWEDYFPNYLHMLPTKTLRSMGKDFVKFFLKRADINIAPTKRIGQTIERYKIKKPYEILPTGINDDVTTYNKSYEYVFFNRLHKIFPKIQKKHILLYVGRIGIEKNIPFLFKMLGEVRKTITDAVLLIVGGGPELENLKKEAKTYSYSWNICFTGYCKRDELAYFYNFADLFVFSSLTETQGLVTIEAMRTGLPVVAIGEMGTVDVMQGDNGGFMVKNDLQEFSNRVVQLLSDKELYEKKSEEAKEWSKKWSMEPLTEKLLNIYQQAIDINKLNHPSVKS